MATKKRPVRQHSKQPIDRAAGGQHINARPDGAAAEQGQQRAHRLYVETGAEVPAGEPCKAGGHATRRAGDSGALQPFALGQPKARWVATPLGLGVSEAATSRTPSAAAAISAASSRPHTEHRRTAAIG